jgi:hypothetical protein
MSVLLGSHAGVGGCSGWFLELPCLAIFYLAAKLSHMCVWGGGGDIDRLAYSLHHPTVCGR